MMTKTRFDEYVDVLCGGGDDHTKARVRAELQREGSYGQRLIEGVRVAGEHVLDLDWSKLLGGSEDEVEPATTVSVVDRQNRWAATRQWLAWGSAACIVLALVGISILIGTFGGSDNIVQLRDGERKIRLDEGGTLSGLETHFESWQKSLVATLQSRRFEVSPAIAKLTREVRELGVRSTENPYLALTRPVNTVIRTDQPTLHWKEPEEGADDYVVTVYDLETEQVIAGATTTSTHWQVPRSLDRGRAYAWHVVAKKGTRKWPAPARGIPDPSFKVIDQESLTKIEENEKDLSTSHLLLCLFYIEQGLLDDAESELQVLLKTNKDHLLLEELSKSLQRLRRGSS
jgi:hypothetical protein